MSSSEIQIRPFTIRDRRETTELLRNTGPDAGISTTDLLGASHERDLEPGFVHYLKEEGVLAVAVDANDNIVGMISVFPRKEQRQFMDIRRLIARGDLAEKVAEILICHAKERVTAKQRHAIGVVVRTSDAQTLAFFKKQHFVAQTNSMPGGDRTYLRHDIIKNPA